MRSPASAFQTGSDAATACAARRASIQIATTDAQKDAIYRLRFDVYVQELAGSRHDEADPLYRQLRDEWDERAYHLFAERDGLMMACIRVNLRRDGPLECEQFLEMVRLTPAFPDQVSTTSRFAIHPTFRGTGLFTRMACAVYELHRKLDLRFQFIDCHPDLVPLYARLGFRIYKPGFQHPKYVKVIPMVHVLDDLEYLEHVRSPYVPIARRFPSSAAGRSLLISRFPEAALGDLEAQLQPQLYLP